MSIIMVVVVEGDWFAVVNTYTGVKTVQQGIGKNTQGAVGPYATKREAKQWAALGITTEDDE